MPLDNLRLFSTLTAVILLIAVFELGTLIAGSPVPLQMRSLKHATELHSITEKGVQYAPPETVGPLGGMEPVGQEFGNRSESEDGIEKGSDSGCGVWKEKGMLGEWGGRCYIRGRRRGVVLGRGGIE